MSTNREFGYRIPIAIVRQLEERSSMRCEECGTSHSKERFKGLQVHHKDENRKNNVLTNLIVLCRSCHTKNHARDFKGFNNPMYGRKHSRYTKNKIALKARGRINPMLGRKHTDEACRKMSLAAKERWKLCRSSILAQRSQNLKKFW